MLMYVFLYIWLYIRLRRDKSFLNKNRNINIMQIYFPNFAKQENNSVNSFLSISTQKLFINGTIYTVHDKNRPHQLCTVRSKTN